ncbi:unnamed protein product [Phyllotreta striolata]|uniref:PKS/mFAS DH domain-containing protein n=1 Tax=Phyllotreta striolata TaxID=444603 RepID=A0A9P0DWN4_PHYSR|nr:unnamed protein product [Phyllotreta striolata]
MIIPTFSATIEKAQRLLLPKGVDVGDSVFGSTESKAKHQTLGCILVQLGLIDVFKQLQINPTNYFGHSFGEILAGYFDGILTFKQTVLCAFVIDDVVDKVGELPDKYRGNNKNTIFANFRAAFKSPDCARIKKNLLSNLSNVLDMPKNRRKGEEEKFGSAEYFLNALKSESAAKFEYVESNSIVLSCGVVPSPDAVPDDVRIIQIGDTEDNLVSFLRILGNLYVNGYNPLISKLYPDVKFPVSRGTRMISPFIKWNHHRDWFTPSYDLQATNSAQHGARKVKIHFGDQQWAFARGHVIDGRVLFPATGYLYLVWETMALIEEMPMTVKNVVFEDVRFVRASTLPKRGYLIFRITINRLSGGFEITEGDSIVVSGKIHSKDNEHFERSENFYEISDELTLSSKDVYKELRLRGYNYSGGFRSIEQCNVTATRSLIKWEDNWTTFMDNLLQLRILQTDTRLLYVPTYIQQLVLPAKQQLEFINTNYLKLNRKPVLPAYCDDLTGEIRCGYLKIKGLMASSINKRKDLGVPVLESYQFVPNVAELTLGESMRVNMQIFCENSLVKKLKIVELVDEFTVDGQQLVIPLVQSAFEDQPLMTPLCKVLSKKAVETTVQIEDKELKSERDCHIIVGTCLLSRPAVVKTAFDSLKDNGFIISRENLEADVSNTNIQNFTIFTVHTTPSEIIVFLKKTAGTKELTTIKVSSSDFAWLETAKDLIKLKKTDNLLLYAENDPLTGCLGLVNCLRREPDSPFVRALILLDPTEEFSPHNPFYKHQLDKHMAVNVWKNAQWGTYRHLPLPKPPPVRSQHCYANTTVRGDISSLRWIESYLRQDMSVPVEKELVRVHYAALNFRDVMTASGKINNDVITRDRIEQECVQGFEFSGLDRNGRRVMGMVTQGALSSLILADKYLVFDVPDAMSLEEAATIPVVYGTVIYGMIIRGRLRRNESVLIHSGTGGIGQAAIRLALHYGCTVFTTVGTQEKREYLLRTFPEIDERHIGNSRDLSFERMVIAGTAGRGVDMVINSLAERKQIASVRCLGAGGRFVEIGKFDLASNSDLSLLLLDKGASFHGVMLDSLMACTPEVKREITGILNDNIGKFVVPLTSTVFGYEQVEDAFRFMSTGKHMGKVLIRVRDGMDQSVQKFDGIPRYYCYPDKTYVIVGGLGGFGLELADWLVLRGAKNLVLTSRRGITTGYQKLRTNTWISYGVNVRVSKEDVTSESGCANMLKEAGKLGEVHAIFNLAVVLADSLFENQTDATFKTSFGPKAIATMHLDNISRKLCPRLRDFVVFSSVSCGRGNAGQTNYGMSNSVMERICEKRKLEGYPALAIQWGAVGDVGLVAELQEEHVALEIGGTLQQKISNCLNVLNAFLRQTEATVVSSIVVAEKRGLESCDNIVDTVINILGLNTSKAVSHHATLPELGMDSMTGVEIKQTLEREYEIFLTPKDIKSMTLAKLKEIQEQKCISSDDSESNDIKLVLEDVGDGEETRLVEVRLNPDLDAGVATKVLLFPGIEGFARKFKILAANLVAPAVAFQFWETTEFATIQDIARSLLPAVEKHVEKGEKFNFVLYSFGSLIGLEIVHLLELKGYVGNVVIIDGGTVLMKQLAQSWLQESERMFETGLLSHLLSFYLPTEVISENQEKLLKCDTWKERLEVAKDIIRPITPDKLELHTKLANGFYNRIKAIDAYSPSYDKLKSKLRLWKPAVGLTKDIEEDYGLSRISESPIDIETFDGNHLSILHNRLVAESINSIITSIN